MDVDGDADIDLLTSEYSYDRFSWWENTANGASWTSEHVITESCDGAYSIDGVDVDGDGNPDFAGVHPASSVVFRERVCVCARIKGWVRWVSAGGEARVLSQFEGLGVTTDWSIACRARRLRPASCGDAPVEWYATRTGFLFVSPVCLSSPSRSHSIKPCSRAQALAILMTTSSGSRTTGLRRASSRLRSAPTWRTA